ncbi:MAG: aspartate-semialdehyde dehydrogenase [Candidatus Zixiibacteriota bacterium]
MSYKISIIGATGLVGRKMIQVMHERKIDIEKLYALTSSKSAGQKTDYYDEKVLELKDSNIEDCDFALFAVDSEISKKWAPKFAKKGAFVIDNSSAFRLDANISLIVPEVNPEVIPQKPAIVANPNCSTIQLVAALKPISGAIGIESVDISTYQAVSGAGKAAIDALRNRKDEKTQKDIFGHIIYNNVIPKIGPFLENGFCKEEMKLIDETRKILGLPNLNIYPTVVRVPVENCHAESIRIQLARKADIDEIRDILSNAPGIVIADGILTQKDIDGRDEVFISRIRQMPDDKRNVMMWIVADNLRKGAATNAIQIMENIISRSH